MPPPPVTSLPNAYMLLPNSPWRDATKFGAISLSPAAMRAGETGRALRMPADMGAPMSPATGWAAAMASMNVAELPRSASLKKRRYMSSSVISRAHASFAQLA